MPKRWFAREGGEFATVEFAVNKYCGVEMCCGETGKGVVTGGCGCGRVVVSEVYCEQADLSENNGRR